MAWHLWHVIYGMAWHEAVLSSRKTLRSAPAGNAKCRRGEEEVLPTPPCIVLELYLTCQIQAGHRYTTRTGQGRGFCTLASSSEGAGAWAWAWAWQLEPDSLAAWQPGPPWAWTWAWQSSRLEHCFYNVQLHADGRLTRPTATIDRSSPASANSPAHLAPQRMHQSKRPCDSNTSEMG